MSDTPKDLCWECTGSGLMGGGYPCKICRGTGILRPAPKEFRVLFVGIHNKPGMAPLDSRTKSGKLIDRIIKELPSHEVIKTNLFDKDFLPEGPNNDAAFKWAERVGWQSDDIVITLGAITHPYFRRTNIRFIPMGHPSGVWSNDDKNLYVQRALNAINFALA